MTFPPEDRREPFLIRNQAGHYEAGFLTDGQCGGRHIEGPSFTYWRCPTCLELGIWRNRRKSRRTLQQQMKQMLNLFYPDKDPS